MNKSNENKKILVKKYANRRLYNTNTSSYVTLDDLFNMVKQGVDFEVLDAKSGEDLTRNVLTQIIFEQEAKGYSVLPVNFLRQIILFYGDKAASVLPQYLEMSIKAFSNNREKMQELCEQGENSCNPVNIMQTVAKQNLQLFENTFNMFFGSKKESE